MSLFNSMNVSASGMTAQLLRTDIISQNIANVNTTRGTDGKAYVRKTVVFAEKDTTSFSGVLQNVMNTSNGVKVTKIVEDTDTPMREVYDPSHPDADANGYVSYPNVNTVTEMTNLIDASRSYEANVTCFNGAKAMEQKALEIGK
ncbi:MAG TPA: flagellar basal body rod protein FlgC [Lachnospiraceae bacterium]|nr:flagellar basal body rod protein FlgC [Lachnospiraceae bacterium]